MAVQKQTSPQRNREQRWPHKRYWRSCASLNKRRASSDRLGTVRFGYATAMRRCRSSSSPQSQKVPSYARSTRQPAEIWTQGTKVLPPLQGPQAVRGLRSKPECSSLQIGWQKRTIGRLGIQPCRQDSFTTFQFSLDLGNRLQHRLNLDHVVASVNNLCGDGFSVKCLTVLGFNCNSFLL